jgi:predicted metalloprotease with PDZ domain
MPTNPVKPISGPSRGPTVRKSFTKKALADTRAAPILAKPFGKNSFRFAAHIALLGCWLLLNLTSVSNAYAQTLKAKIRLTDAPARIRIELVLPRPTKTLSFRNTYAGVLGLGERIEMPAAINDAGESVPVQKLAPGEFKSSDVFSRFSYDVNVTELARPAHMSHVTWLQRDQGLLMLSDLLPQPTSNSDRFASAVISIEVPAGWRVASNLKREGSEFSTNDPESGVFLVGSSVKESHQRLAATDFAIVTAGEWPFSHADAIKIAGKIMEEHLRVTRFPLKSNVVLMLVPYPGKAGPESWSAETRGNDVVLVLGKNASRRKVSARLGIVLSHELFHLWVPNSLSLKGDYDWFFEGFTLYQALRTDLRLGLISFDDYLETMAGVFDSYHSSADGDRLSLLEASERRWTISSSLVYEKGMLVAFVYDLMLQNLTDCGASLDDVYRDLFRVSATGHGSATETIISILGERDGLKSFARDYVESRGGISLEPTLSTYGIQLQQGTGGATATKLVVSRDLSKPQRRLLRCIGYKR